jgi:hypothetical protein
VLRIAMQLDEVLSSSHDISNPLNTFERPSKLSNIRNKADSILDHALRYAIYAYAVRWLPLRSAFEASSQVDATKASQQQQEIREQLWCKARQTATSALTRPTYRSIVILLLFTLTEMPINCDDPEFSQLCSHTLLSFFNCLRSPFKPPKILPLSQSTTAVPHSQDALEYTMPRQRHNKDMKYQLLQDSIFWLGVLCDTSWALIHQTQSVILPGRSGDKKVWDLIRQRTVIFDQSFRVLHDSLLPLSPDIIVVVLQHASACKTMYSGVVVQFCDSVFHHNVESVESAARQVSEESRRFHDVFDRLLALCARDYLAISPESQVNYCEC